MADKIIRTLVVDDTITYRNIVKMALSDIDGVEVIGTAPNGEIALEKIELLRPDLVTLDVEMPKMSGLQALDLIKEKYPEIGVIMVSGVSSGEATMRALRHGALDFIGKPEGSNADESIKMIRSSLKLMIDAFVVQETSRHNTPVRAKRVASQPVKKPIQGFDLLAIGSSTGGPNALTKILPQLSANFPVPIVIVQHMPAGFTSSLAKSLNKNSQIHVSEVSSGDELKPGCAHIAPGGKHMTFKREKRGAISHYLAELNENPHVNNCRPSIDVTFESLAGCFQGNVLSVILTGMGADGLGGVKSFKFNREGYCITQSEESCVVYGMPRAVDLEGLSDSSQHLENIGETISNLIGSREYVASTN